MDRTYNNFTFAKVRPSRVRFFLSAALLLEETMTRSFAICICIYSLTVRMVVVLPRASRLTLANNVLRIKTRAINLSRARSKAFVLHKILPLLGNARTRANANSLANLADPFFDGNLRLRYNWNSKSN